MRRRSSVSVIAVVVASLGCSVLASFTRPFTLGADLVTALPLAIGAFATLLRMLGRLGSSGPVATRDGEPSRLPVGPRWLMTWLVTLATVTAWELYCVASEPRAQYPTLSTLLNLVDSSRTGKASVFALWLVLGWFLVSR